MLVFNIQKCIAEPDIQLFSIGVLQNIYLLTLLGMFGGNYYWNQLNITVQSLLTSSKSWSIMVSGTVKQTVLNILICC